ncbi:MAG: Ig-like domain-containing protein, partial [Candidatus Kariarchaeaceae archaeon]
GESFTLNIILNDTDNNLAITGALVKYTYTLGQGELGEVGNGLYQVQFDNVPEGSYSITVTVYAGDDYDFERFVVSLNVAMPPEQTLMYQILTFVAISATIGIGGYLIAYQRVLKYPVPVRKVRKYRNKYRKKFVKADILHREDAFNSLYVAGLGKAARMLKGIPIMKVKAVGLEAETEAEELIKPEKAIQPKKELKEKIVALEKDMKKTMKVDGIRGSELMRDLSKLYKQLGEEKKARYLFDKQKTLRIQMIHEMREEVVNIAQTAEKDQNWEVAADNYAQAKILSTRLLDEGRMMEAERVKKYSLLEKKARNRLPKKNE